MKWRRWWLAVPLVLSVLVAAAVHVIVERSTQEPPNYSQIEDGLWLGGYVAEPPPGTQAVLDLCEAEDSYHAAAHRWEPIRDAEPAPSLDWLGKQVDFIASERAAGRTVFVHCINGASRSAMVLAAYLMQREGWSRDRAVEYLRSRRPEVRPNPAFMELLLKWEERLKHIRR